MRCLRLIGLAAAFTLLSLPSAKGMGGRGFMLPTLSEVIQEFAQNGGCVVIAERVGAAEGGTFRIVRVLRGEDLAAVGQEVTNVSFGPTKEAKGYLLMGGKDEGRLKLSQWCPLTEAAIEYVSKLPAEGTPSAERLKHFAGFLGSNDPIVAEDVFIEISTARWEDVVSIAESLPRKELRRGIACSTTWSQGTDTEEPIRTKIREWIARGKLPEGHLGLYGLLLGACGEKDDAAFLKRAILLNPDGTDMAGVMAGYLLLAGEEGLEFLEETKIKPHYVDVLVADGRVPPSTIERRNKVTWSETDDAHRAIRFVWDHGEGKIPKERLRQSILLLLLEHRRDASAAIRDLARWKEWGMQDRIVAMYGDEKYPSSNVDREVVIYLMKCIEDTDPNAKAKPEHVVKGRKNLEMLRQRDPEGVARAEGSYASERRLAAERKRIETEPEKSFFLP